MRDDQEYWLSTLGKSQPLYATKPTPGAPNDLAKVEHVAAVLKTPLLPWQRYFIRVITEKNPDGSYRYGTVLLTVPRQSGKTTAVRALYATRALLTSNRRLFMTAQTGRDSRERLFELAEQISPSVLGKTVKVRRAADSPGITFHNGSKIGSFSPTPESLHGYNMADVFLDEIFAWDESQGGDLLGAAVPAMQTHKDRQLIMVSTKGTSTATFLNGWIAKGRLATTDPESEVAYLEWGLADGLEPFDPENWDFHPGLQGGLITKKDISRAAETMSAGEFTRAYMNRYTDTVDSTFNLAQWDSLNRPLEIPKASQVAYAYEVASDRSKAAVVAAWKIDGHVYIKVVKNAPGTTWLKPLLVELKDNNPLMLGADKYAQNNVIADDFHNEYPSAKFQQLTGPDAATASVSFKARVEDGTLSHEGDLVMRQAISTALTRTFGDSGWAFSHKSEPELMAAITACRFVDEVKTLAAPAAYFD